MATVTNFRSPWANHPNTVVLDDSKDIKEALKKSHLDWTVSKHETYHKKEDGTFEETGAYCIKRNDNGALLTQGTSVGPHYTPLQNVQSFEFFNDFLATGDVSLENAGVLAGGAKVWVLARLEKKPLVVGKDDEINKYLLLSNSHNGSSSVKLGFTPVRVFCGNCLTMAIRHNAAKILRVRHNRRLSSNLESIKEAINAMDAAFEANGELYRRLQNTGINQNDLVKYVKNVFGMAEKENRKGEVTLATRTKHTLENIIAYHDREMYGEAERKLIVQELLDTKREREQALLDTVLEISESPTNLGTLKHKSTAWSAFNAVNQYLNYDRGHNVDTRLDSLWNGSSAQLNEKALDLALEMAGVDVSKLQKA